MGVCSSVFGFACEDEKFKNQIKQIVSLILIIIVASALLKFDYDELLNAVDTGDISAVQPQNVMSKAVCEQTALSLEDYILNALSEEGIIPLDVSIQLTVSEDNLVEISSTRILLSCSDKNSTAYIRQLISQLIPQGELDVYWEE